MNLFYVATPTSTYPDYVVDSNLSLQESPILLPRIYDGYSFEGSIIFTGDYVEGNISLYLGTANPLTCSANPIPIYESTSLKDSYNEVHVMSITNGFSNHLYKVSKNGVFSLIDSIPYAKIAYGNGIYCYVYPSGTNELTVCKSIDGDSWETTTTITTTKDARYFDICFGNNSFIICAGEIYKSEDCTTWTEVYTEVYTKEDDPRKQIIHTSFGFLILTDHYLLKSFDGITWNVLSLPPISIPTPHDRYWSFLVVNEDTICLTFENHDILSELLFSLDGGSSWGNSLIINVYPLGIFALSEDKTGNKFWTDFKDTTEYL